MANRFNDGIIDLSSLREKKKAEKEVVQFDPNVIMKTIPSSFQATDDQGNELEIEVQSVAILPEKVYLILHDGKEGEPPFLMIGRHERNIFIEELTPATEEDLVHYNKMVEEYRKHEAEQQAAEAAQHVQNEREAQLKEMLDKAETEEERQQILAMMNN